MNRFLHATNSLLFNWRYPIKLAYNISVKVVNNRFISALLKLELKSANSSRYNNGKNFEVKKF